MIVCLQLEKSFVFSGGGIHGTDVRRIASVLKEKYGEKAKVCEDSFDKCVVKLDLSRSPEDIKRECEEVVLSVIGKEADKTVYSLTVKPDENEAAQPQQPVQAESHAQSGSAPVQQRNVEPEQAPEAEEKPVIERIADMVGAADFKKLCQEIHSCSSFICKHHTQEAFLSDSYIFSVGVGGGFSHSLSLLSELLVKEGIFSGAGGFEELSLPDPNDAEAGDKLRRVGNTLDVVMSSARIVSFDISNWIDHTSTPAFKDFLLSIYRMSGKALVIFRVPVISNKQLKLLKNDISDVVPVKPIVFEPFDAEQQKEIAQRVFANSGFTAEDGVWDILNDCVNEEKRDGYYYEIYTIRKIAKEMINCASVYCAKNNISDCTVTEPAVSDMRPVQDSGKTPVDEQLDSIIGMDEVKQQLYEIAAQISFSRSSGINTMPCMHMRFVGNPGTGKTTIARIFGQLLNEKGILRIGKLYEHKGRDLCGKYVGHTAPKTAEICQEAYGSVLFIDEAYSLYRGDSTGNDFGREAIDTLITEMENHSDDLVVIFAGYPDDMDEMLNANSGLKSRIPYTINFPSYSRETLCDIFISMAQKYFSCDENLRPAATDYFNNLSDDLLESKAFGNGRFVRNLYERTWGKATARCHGQKVEDIVLTAEDFNAAAAALSVNQKTETHTPIGF